MLNPRQGRLSRLSRFAYLASVKVLKVQVLINNPPTMLGIERYLNNVLLGLEGACALNIL